MLLVNPTLLSYFKSNQKYDEQNGCLFNFHHFVATNAITIGAYCIARKKQNGRSNV